MKFKLSSVFCCLGLCLATSTASADIMFNFAQGNLAANATFSKSGDNLTITLRNTATVDVANPTDVLTGLFFDIAGPAALLTRVSALLESLTGTPVLFASGTNQPFTGYNGTNGDVGSEVGYRTGASTQQAGIGDHAIGHVGMEDFLGVQFMGAPTRFDSNDANNLQGPLSPNGIEYGLVNSTYTGGGNNPVNGPNALITNGMIYTFTGFAGFNESDISNIRFNYGTEFNPVIPAPPAVLLGILGFSMVGLIKKRLG